MPLQRLIDLLAEAAVRKLAQEREAKQAAPDGVIERYARRSSNALGFAVIGEPILKRLQGQRSPKPAVIKLVDDFPLRTVFAAKQCLSAVGPADSSRF